MGEKPFDIRERTFLFGSDIIRLCLVLEERRGGIKLLANQLLRSGTSIGANIEEGYGTQTDPDFINKFTIALKEARETSYWLRQLQACDLMPSGDVEPLINESEEIKKILGAIITKKRTQ
jgi:four helix bundle protein